MAGVKRRFSIENESERAVHADSVQTTPLLQGSSMSPAEAVSEDEDAEPVNKKQKLDKSQAGQGSDQGASEFGGMAPTAKITRWGSTTTGKAAQYAWVLDREMTTKEEAKFRDTITANFGTRILYKHNELRLIDQEIAKCQAALEQLRRCSEIPYPSMTGTVEDMARVSTGSGPALLPPRQTHPAVSPAPWGVTEGPYTRHYSRWLLPDPAFDGGLAYAAAPGAQFSPDQLVRGRGVLHASEGFLTSGRSRTARGSANAVLQSLPSGYAQPKPERSAQVIKRHSDGMFVKLVCPGFGCGEERFNSVQGFINHCRIKHQIHFATHEDAAQRAGTTEGVDQSSGTMTDGPSSQPSHRERMPSIAVESTEISTAQSIPQVRTPTTQAEGSPSRRSSVDTFRLPSPTITRTVPGHKTTPQKTIPSITSRVQAAPSLSHPYNRADLDTSSEWPAHHPSQSSPKQPSGATKPRQRRQSTMGPPVSPGFVPSDQLPYLSERFAHAGKAGNLQAMVEEARNKFDLDNVLVPDDVMDMDDPAPTAVLDPGRSRVPKDHETVGGLGAPLMSRRPGSKKGLQRGGDTELDIQQTGPELGSDSFLVSPGMTRRTTATESTAKPAGRRSSRAKLNNKAAMGSSTIVRELQAQDRRPVDDPAPLDLTMRADLAQQTPSASPIELSPNAHHPTDTNQAPSLVSDDGQSVSEYEDDDSDEEADDGTPKPTDSSTHISFDAGDELVTDSAGPSRMNMDEKLEKWAAETGPSRSQGAAM